MGDIVVRELWAFWTSNARDTRIYTFKFMLNLHLVDAVCDVAPHHCINVVILLTDALKLRVQDRLGDGDILHLTRGIPYPTKDGLGRLEVLLRFGGNEVISLLPGGENREVLRHSPSCEKKTLFYQGCIDQ